MFIGIYFLAALFGGLSFVSGIMQTHRDEPPTQIAQLNKTTSAPKETIDPLKDALQKINTIIREEKKSNLYLISCTYKMSGEKILGSAIEVHFNQYRKKPKFEYIPFNSNQEKSDGAITFVYNTHKKYLMQVSKNDKHHSEEVKYHRLTSKPTVI